MPTPARATRRPKKRSRRRRPGILGWLVRLAGALIVAGVVGPAIVFLMAYIVTDVPKPSELVTNQISFVYASDGKTELARIIPPEGNREDVTIDQIPEHLKAAVISAEDRKFWTNPGFSVTGFGRAVLGQLTGNTSAGGGSTITQQYVKNAVVGNERSVKRKVKELLISIKMANEWRKDQVLEAYLNTIYFGRGSYGVASAAKAYFGKPLGELTPAESAVLAASIQRPSQLDPWTNREEALARWNYVLDGEETTGFLTKKQRDTMVYPQVTDPANNPTLDRAVGTNGLIKGRVLEEIARVGISEHSVQTRGLRITTTIDPVAQGVVVDRVHANIAGTDPKLRTGVVSVRPATGEILAYYGGDDPNGWDFAHSGVPTGSTFKIFGLAAALQQGIPLSKEYSSAPIDVAGTTITNSDGDPGCGVCAISEALKHSYNTSFIRLEEDLRNGPADVADMAHAAGIARTLTGKDTTLSEGGGPPYPGIILGQYPTRVLDMAVGLATLTNSGIWQKPHFVNRVIDADGQVLYEAPVNTGERRLSAQVADNVINAMLPIAGYSNGNNLAGGRPSAAKTGTVQLGQTGFNQGAWMIGSTPQVATAVWVGTVDNSPLKTKWGGNMYGAQLPATIWKAVMDGQLQGKKVQQFPAAKPIGWRSPFMKEPVTLPKPDDDKDKDHDAEEGIEPPPLDDGTIEILPGIRVPDLFNLNGRP